MRQFIDDVSAGHILTEKQMRQAMEAMISGEQSAVEIAEFLSVLHDRGEAAEEILGAAKVLREHASIINAPYDCVDCCGTGGDGANTYNVSTAVALVCAALGVPMAKHGNRAASSKSGAADVLEALGVNLDLTTKNLEEALKLFKFAFLMAPKHHEALVHVKEARRLLPHRTLFNLLGPLANPAGTKYQLLGVFDKKWVVPLAEVLKSLGTARAWVVHGADGLDEITINAETYLAVLDEGKITEKVITPEDFGLERSDLSTIKGGDAQENAKALRCLLEGNKSPYRDIVLANASAVLNIHGNAKDLKDGVKKAAQAIDTGEAYNVLTDYISFTREHMEAA